MLDKMLSTSLKTDMAEPETTIDLLTIKARPGSGFYEIFCIFANISCLCIHLVRLFNLPCIDIANGFNRFFSNIGPALARNIPNGTTNFTNYLNQKVEESIFLNPVTDEEIIEIVKDAKTKYSKDHDSIDMSLVKLVIPY